MITCQQCAKPFDRVGLRGPAPAYCSGACRQAAHRDRTAMKTPSAIVAELMVQLAEMTAPVFEQGAGLRDRLASEGWSPTIAEMLAANVTMTNLELLKMQMMNSMRVTNDKETW